MNTNEMRIDAAFKELKMPGATRSWRPLIRDAQTKGQDPGVFLAALLESELISRRENRLRMLLAEAHFPEAKTLDTFDFTAQPSVPKTKVLALASADFLKQRESVVCIGPPGTGKTHLSSAIGVSCIHAGFRVSARAGVFGLDRGRRAFAVAAGRKHRDSRDRYKSAQSLYRSHGYTSWERGSKLRDAWLGSL